MRRITGIIITAALMAGLLISLWGCDAGSSKLTGPRGIVSGHVYLAAYNAPGGGGRQASLNTTGYVPVQGATVTIKTTHFSDATDAQGYFEIAGVPQGQQTAVVSMTGYDDQEFTIQVQYNQNTNMDTGVDYPIALVPNQAGTLIVTATSSGSGLPVVGRVLVNGVDTGKTTSPAAAFNDIKPGTYSIGMTAVGYVNPTAQQAVITQDGDIVTLNFVLDLSGENAPPYATIILPINGSEFTQGSTVAFTGNGTDIEDGQITGAGLVWTSDLDGQIGTGNGFTKSDLSLGLHRITLTATDSGGLTGTAWVQVRITETAAQNTRPVAAIMSPANRGKYLYAQEIQFNGYAADTEDGTLLGASLVWSSSLDGQIGTGSNFRLDALSLGDHSILLTATDSAGMTDTASINISVANRTAVNVLPSIAVISPPRNAAFLQGSAVKFLCYANDLEDGALTGSSIVWNSSINGAIGTGTSFSTSSLSVGNHVIVATATDSIGYPAIGSVMVRIVAPGTNQPPNAAIVLPFNGAAYMDTRDPISFSGLGTDTEDGLVSQAGMFWYSNMDGLLGVGTTFTLQSLGVGNHEIWLTAVDSQGMAVNSGSVHIQINPYLPPNQMPTAAITSPGHQSQWALGGNITFIGTGLDNEDGALTGGSLVWTSSIDGQFGTGNYFTYSGLSAGTHVITLTATDSRDGHGTATVAINIVDTGGNSYPTATIILPVDLSTYPQGTNITFVGAGIDPENGPLSGDSLVWNSDMDGQIGTGTLLNYSELSMGTHTITFTATDSGGLSDTASITLYITGPAENQPPTATIASPGNDSSYSSGQTLIFSGAGIDPETGFIGGGNLVWTSSIDNQFGTGPFFTYSALSPGTHTITLTATDSEGLSGSDQIQLTINP